MLKTTGRNGKNLALREKQVENFIAIKRKQNTATALLSIKEKLGLQGNFDLISKSLVSSFECCLSEPLSSSRIIVNSSFIEQVAINKKVGNNIRIRNCY